MAGDSTPNYWEEGGDINDPRYVEYLISSLVGAVDKECLNMIYRARQAKQENLGTGEE